MNAVVGWSRRSARTRTAPAILYSCGAETLTSSPLVEVTDVNDDGYDDLRGNTVGAPPDTLSRPIFVGGPAGLSTDRCTMVRWR